MKWLKMLAKCLTQSGRQGVVRELLKEYVTTEMATRFATREVNDLLGKVRDKERLGAVALNLEQGAALVADISAAVKDGEVTADEAAQITQRTQALMGNVIDQAKVDDFIEHVVAKVP